MTVAPSARWGAYALAALLTLAAALWVGDGDDAAVVVQPTPRSAMATTAASAGPAPAEAGSLRLALPTARRAQGATADPFAVLGGAPDDGAAAGVAARAPASAPPAALAPPLPFVYLGSWKEHGKTLIFVQRDERAYKIDGPGPLDAEYSVRSVDGDRISLIYQPLGIVQELHLDAPAAARPVAAAPPVQSSPEPEAGEN